MKPGRRTGDLLVAKPYRGEVWRVSLNPVRGHEQGGERPCLVFSDDRWNQGHSELVIVVPMTSNLRPNPFHVQINPPEGGLQVPSNILCEHVKSISTDRLLSRYGTGIDRHLIRSG